LVASVPVQSVRSEGSDEISFSWSDLLASFFCCVCLEPLRDEPHALSRAASLPNVIFEVLRSTPSLMPSEDTEGEEEAAGDTGVPKKSKRVDE
jgi:hypothetical protein